RARRPRARVAESQRVGRARVGALRTRGLQRRRRCPADVPPAERRRARVGSQRDLMAAEPENIEVEVHVAPMRRRHLRGVVRIEAQVYPRPWSHSLFVSELALRSSRSYVVAKVGRDVVGYAGLMMSLTDGHVTTIAVDP